MDTGAHGAAHSRTAPRLAVPRGHGRDSYRWKLLLRMPTRPLSPEADQAEFQIHLLMVVDDDDANLSPDELRRLGRHVGETLEFAAEFVGALAPHGWRAHLNVDAGALAAWLDKIAPANAIHADLRALPERLYAQLLDYLPILARRDGEIDELRPTEHGFEPFKIADR